MLDENQGVVLGNGHSGYIGVVCYSGRWWGSLYVWVWMSNVLTLIGLFWFLNLCARFLIDLGGLRSYLTLFQGQCEVSTCWLAVVKKGRWVSWKWRHWIVIIQLLLLVEHQLKWGRFQRVLCLILLWSIFLQDKFEYAVIIGG